MNRIRIKKIRETIIKSLKELKRIRKMKELEEIRIELGRLEIKIIN